MASPWRTRSSPVFTIAVTSAGSWTATIPRSIRAAPTPPARHVTGMEGDATRRRKPSGQRRAAAENGRMRRLAALGLATLTAAAALVTSATTAVPAGAVEEPEYRELHFPVEGPV